MALFHDVKPDRLVNGAIAALLLAGGLLCAAALTEEIAIARLRTRADNGESQEARIRPLPATMTAASSPRAALYRALITVREAAGTPAAIADRGRRSALLQQAEAELDIARQARPVWGQAHVVGAFAAAITPGGARRALDELALSYRQMPYDIDAAPWRVRVGATNWLLLSERTQAQVVDEAIWYASLSSQSAATIRASIGDGDANYYFLLRRGRFRPVG